jgi:hypothetical protein
VGFECEFELEAIAHFLRAAIAGMFFCVNNVVVYRNALKKIWRSLLPSCSKPVTAATKLSYTACQAELGPTNQELRLLQQRQILL